MATALLWISFVAVIGGVVLAAVVALSDLKWVLAVRAQLAERAKAAQSAPDSQLSLARQAKAWRNRVPAPRTEAEPRRGIGTLTVPDDDGATGPRRGLGARPSLVIAEDGLRPEEQRGLGRRSLSA